MKQAIIIHGCCNKDEYFSNDYPSSSNSHWIPWVQKQLLMEGVFAQTPEMPKPYTPEYNKWKMVFERFAVDTETILIGHSCGAGFLLRWLGENKIQIEKLVLVAPWLDPLNKRKGFLDFEIDHSIPKRVKNIHILYSNDESVEGVRESVEIIAAAFPNAQTHTFDNMGHFTFGEMGTTEFPVLMEILR